MIIKTKKPLFSISFSAGVFSLLILFVLSNSVASAEALSTAPTMIVKNKMLRLPTPDSDRETSRVLSSLLTQAGLVPDLSVTVKDGMVTLHGKVKSKKQIEWLHKAAAQLPEVVTVIDKTEEAATALTDWSPVLNEIRTMTDIAKRGLPNIFLALFMIMIFYFFNRSLNRGLHSVWQKHISNLFLLNIVSKLSLLPIWILFFYFILKTAGLSGLATTIIGGTGMLGLILGLAFRGIAENYLAGVLLAIRSPFTKGDLIEIGSHLGYVQNLSMRGTTIINLDGNLVLIPNSTVIQSVVQNRTANPLTRTSFMVGISYADSISQAQDIIIKALPEVRGVLKDPEISVIAESLGGASVNLKVMFWFDIKKSNEPRVRSRAMIHIKETLLAHGISLPDSEREIVFADTLKVQMLESKEDVKTQELDRKEQIKTQAVENLEQKRQHQEAPEPAQDKDLMRLADASPLLQNRSTDALLKP